MKLKDFDLIEFLVHFFFGAILGTIASVRWMASGDWKMCAGMALAVGLIGGFYGDRFWNSVFRSGWWWR